MTKEYFITEAQRIEIVNGLDRLAGTRGLANFFEQGILTQVAHPKHEEDLDAKKKSESEAAKNADSKAKGKK